MAIFIGVFGSVIGSFLNVVVYRIPIRRSIVSPSACTDCGTPIRSYDNIPVLSWLILRGSCRACSSPISIRYPLVELATAILFGLVTWRFASAIFASDGVMATVAACLQLAAFLYLAAISIALALIDIDTSTLPNRIVYPSYAVGIALLGTAAGMSDNWSAFISALIGMVCLFALYAIIAIAHPGGMGFGDVKLAGLLGLFLGWLGWSDLIVGTFAGFLLGGIFAITLIVARLANRRSGIPFGPWMLAGSWLAIFASAAIASGYLSIFGLA